MSKSVGVLSYFHNFHRIEAIGYSKRCISTSYAKLNPRGLRIERHSKVKEDSSQEYLGQPVEPEPPESDKANCITSSVDPVVLKYTNFVNSIRNGNIQEKVYDTQFGNIRFDSENIPVVHGQFDRIASETSQKEIDNLGTSELVNQETLNSTKNIGEDLNFVDQLWFRESYENYEKTAHKKHNSENIDNIQDVKSDLNFIDEGIFGEVYTKTMINKDNSLQKSILTDVNEKNDGETIDSKDLGSIDQNYFTESFDRINENRRPSIEFQTIVTDFEKAILDMDEAGETKAERRINNEKLQGSESFKFGNIDSNNEVSSTSLNINKLKKFYVSPSSSTHLGHQEIKTDFESAILENGNENDEKCSNFSTNIEVESDATFIDNNSISQRERIDHNQLLAKTEFSNTKPEYSQKRENNENLPKENETAYDYVLKMRKKLEQKELESINDDDDDVTQKKFEKIIQAVLKLDDKSHYDVLKLLKQSILYDKYDIVGLYKPYGMPIHSGGTGARHVLTDYLDDLAKALKVPKLYTLHRLDAETTGVLLLAKTPEMAEKLKGMFKNRQLTKKYLAITKGIPGKNQGILDIPIAEGMIDGRRRMALRPNVKGLKHSRGTSKLAITNYKVLSSVNSSSLMEVVPVTGVKHQIRVHLGFGLGTPVLGDHKYSHLKKIAPQRLSGDILEHLQMPQSKVRKLPRFLHAKSIFIPEIIDGRNVSIQAALPSFFTKAIRMLELQKKRSKVEEKSQNTITIL